jgi:apolipoprotein N-acyltransferase
MDFILILLSGILYILPFFNPNLYFISWFAFIPFLFSIYYNDYKNMFYKSWFLGFIIMFGVGYPLYYPIKIFSNFPSALVILLLIITYLVLSIIYGAWGRLYKLIQRKRSFNPLIFSLTWLGLEIIRHIIYNFFPLGYFGYTQANFNQIIQIADLGGVFLISFLIILFNTLIFKFLISKEIKYVMITIVIIGIVLSYGFYQIDKYEKIEKSFKVGIFNTNISQSQKWQPNNIKKYNDLFINDYLEFNDTDLIITPESALTFDMNEDEKYREEILKKIDEINKYYQIGFLATKEDSKRYYNSTYLITPEGEIKNRYDKNKLVLFGEYVVFEDLIGKITGYRLNTLLSGNEITIFKTPHAKWKTIICSEILYPEYVSKKIDQIDFVINQSNEGWFKNNTTLKNQMYASLIFRAVENRRTFIKTGNMTYSGIVYASGKSMKINNNLNKIVLDCKINSNNTIFNNLLNICQNNF